MTFILGYIYYLLDQYENSLAEYDKAEEILNRCHEESTARMAALYNNKALTLKAYGDYESALELYKKAERIRLSYLPDDHELVLSMRNNIAHTLTEAGRNKEAVSIYEEIIESYKRTMNGMETDNEFLATVFNNAAEAYRALEDYDKAEEYCKNALKMKAVVFGENSIDYAISLNTHAVILYYKEKYEEAEKSVQNSLDVFQSLLPEYHHLTANAFFNLALIYEAEKKDEEALENYHKALQIDSMLGNVDDMIMAAEYIASIYQRYEMFDDEKIYRDYIEKLLEEYS